jgi:hypothetical protein
MSIDLQDPDDGAPGASGFQFWADFKASLTGLTEVLEKQRRDNQAMLARQPRIVTLPGSVVLNGAGAGFIDFGQPRDGRAWTVRQLTTSLQGGEAVAGAIGLVANWYIGTQTGLLVNTMQWRHKQALTPQFDNFTGDHLTVRARESLYVVYSAGTAASTVVSTVVLHDRPMYDRIPTVGE